MILRVTDLVHEASRLFNVTVSDIMGPRRYKLFVRPRSAVAYVARSFRFSYPRIGRGLNREHTTIIGSCRLAEGLLERDKFYRHAVGQMIEFGNARMADDRQVLNPFVKCPLVPREDLHMRMVAKVPLDGLDESISRNMRAMTRWLEE